MRTVTGPTSQSCHGYEVSKAFSTESVLSKCQVRLLVDGGVALCPGYGTSTVQPVSQLQCSKPVRSWPVQMIDNFGASTTPATNPLAAVCLPPTIRSFGSHSSRMQCWWWWLDGLQPQTPSYSCEELFTRGRQGL